MIGSWGNTVLRVVGSPYTLPVECLWPMQYWLLSPAEVREKEPHNHSFSLCLLNADCHRDMRPCLFLAGSLTRLLTLPAIWPYCQYAIRRTGAEGHRGHFPPRLWIDRRCGYITQPGKPLRPPLLRSEPLGYPHVKKRKLRWGCCSRKDIDAISPLFLCLWR